MAAPRLRALHSPNDQQSQYDTGAGRPPGSVFGNVLEHRTNAQERVMRDEH